MAFFRSRLLTIVSLAVVVPTGFYSKFYKGPAHEWVNDSLGGTFYCIFWCLVFFLLLPRAKPARIAWIVLICTCILEFMQLWHPPLLELIRGNFIGRTIIGSTFDWYDFPYYFIGSGLGWLWMLGLQRIGRDTR